MIRPVFLLAVLMLSNISVGQIKLKEEQLAKLDSIAIQDVPKGSPGIATAIISDGNVIYQKYAGFENLEDNSMLDSNSRFNLASNGKQFTALAIILLEDEGKLSLSDDIRKYLPEIYQEIEEKISVKNLLNHTSGIRDIYDLWTLQGLTWWEHTYDNTDALDLIKNQNDLNFPPGSNYLYSNSNYILLAEIIERVSGESFKNFTREMFGDLNMNDTSFEDNYTSIEGPIAIPYFNFDTWSNYEWKWNVVGDGNFFSTLSDQITWEKIVQGYGDPEISREVINRSQQLEGINNKFQYGYGLEFGEYKDMPYRFHEGATGAWKATVTRFEDNQLSVVTMTNSGKTIPAMQTRQMIDVVLDLQKNFDGLITEPKEIGPYVSEEEIEGIYLTPNNFSFEFIKKDDGKLVLNRIGRGETELERESDNVFRQKYDPAFKQEFTKNEKGEMVVTAYYTTHAPYSLTRANSDWNNYNFKMLAGNFVNPETGVEFSIGYDNQKNYKVSINGQENYGMLVTPTKLLVNNYVLDFDKATGEISSFTLAADRIKNVRFYRKLAGNQSAH